MNQEQETELFKISSAFINKVVILAIDKARVGGKEVAKNDYLELSKILGVSEKELRKLVTKPQALTLRQAIKLSNAIGLSVILQHSGPIP